VEILSILSAMKITITTESDSEEGLEANLQSVRNSILMGDLEDMEFEDKKMLIIGGHTCIEIN
jgi:hypothetical protein